MKMRLQELLEVLDAKATITVWNVENDEIYSGLVYGLYNMEVDGYIKDMYLSLGFNFKVLIDEIERKGW